MDRLGWELRRVCSGELPHGEVEAARALEAHGRELVSHGTPYHGLLRRTVRWVEAVERRACARHPGLAEIFVPKCREELEYLLQLWPGVIVFPACEELPERYFRRTRPVPVHVLRLITEPRFADGLWCSPAEFFFHDVDHVRFLIREELLAHGVETPDPYRSEDAYAPASTFDARRGRHRTVLDAAMDKVRGGGLSRPSRVEAQCRWARGVDGRIEALRVRDPLLGEAAALLLFEVVHEKGFPFEARVLREQLSRESHCMKLRAKVAAGFHGPGAVRRERSASTRSFALDVLSPEMRLSKSSWECISSFLPAASPSRPSRRSLIGWQGDRDCGACMLPGREMTQPIPPGEPSPGPRWPLAVTMSDRDAPELARRARRAAEEAGVPYLERTHKRTLASMLVGSADALIVFEDHAISLVDAQGSLRFSPGMAHLRVKQLDAGVEEDMLLRIAGLREGERVLDCTLGLGADAQVAARLVGPTGGVTALEKSPALYLLARYGLELLPRHPRASALQVVHADASEYLRTLPSGAFDVVLFDPMFERQRKSSVAFETLRRHADYAPLTRESVAEAQRVARRAVVIKGSRYSSDFKKLGLRPEPARPNATVLWAKLPGLAAP
ncbi:class I SAM-dependent methyltransferase [Myxococcaceae bacterium GXIMD 01537]